ncbi:MAG: membrane protein insertase YidC, partial [Nitrospirota bacterium]|nr:membrane protein insertase YidC [Nitrospirota bacterium]
MDKRTLLAVVLSLAILLGWSYFFQKPQVQPQTPITEKESVSTTAPSAAAGEQQPVPIQAIPPVTTDSRASDIVIETDLYRAVLSTQGAVVKHWELKKYKNKTEMPVVLLKEPGRIAPLSILFEGADRNLPQGLIYAANTENLRLSEHGNNKG